MPRYDTKGLALYIDGKKTGGLGDLIVGDKKDDEGFVYTPVKLTSSSIGGAHPGSQIAVYNKVKHEYVIQFVATGIKMRFQNEPFSTIEGQLIHKLPANP